MFMIFFVIGNGNIIKFICDCGNKSKIRFSNFKIGVRCGKCGGSECFEYKYVKQYFKDQGCELLSTEYDNAHVILDYIY
jgi:hypothetical protein